MGTAKEQKERKEEKLCVRESEWKDKGGHGGQKESGGEVSGVFHAWGSY